MASIHKEFMIILYTTPKELRELADEMEEKWSKLTIGNSTIVQRWVDKGVNVQFACDQERMPQNPGGLGRK